MKWEGPRDSRTQARSTGNGQYGCCLGRSGSGVRDSRVPGPKEQEQWVLILVPLLRSYENMFRNHCGPQFLMRIKKCTEMQDSRVVLTNRRHPLCARHRQLGHLGFMFPISVPSPGSAPLFQTRLAPVRDFRAPAPGARRSPAEALHLVGFFPTYGTRPGRGPPPDSAFTAPESWPGLGTFYVARYPKAGTEPLDWHDLQSPSGCKNRGLGGRMV